MAATCGQWRSWGSVTGYGGREGRLHQTPTTPSLTRGKPLRCKAMRASNTIPIAICSVVGRNLGEAYYRHASLNALFYEAEAPGDPPEGNCVVKCTTWLKRCNADPNTDALAVLGRVLAEFMDAWPASDDPEYKSRKSEIEGKLAEHGFRYHKERVVGAWASPSTKTLATIIRTKDLMSLKDEFDRAFHSVESDPAAAVTAACSLLEAFCHVYIEDEGLEPPARIGASALWKVVRGHLALKPTADLDRRLTQILNGLANIVDGVSSLRNERGSAHGRGGTRDRIKPRHARLTVNAAHALVHFLLEVWDHRKSVQ